MSNDTQTATQTGIPGADVASLITGLLPQLKSQQNQQELSHNPDLLNAMAELQKTMSSFKPPEPAPAPPPPALTPVTNIQKEGSPNTMDEAKITALFEKMQEKHTSEMRAVQLEIQRSNILRDMQVPKAFDSDVRGNTVEELQQSAQAAIQKHQMLTEQAQKSFMQQYGIPDGTDPEAYKNHLKEQYAPKPLPVPETAEQLAEQIAGLPEHLQNVFNQALNVGQQQEQTPPSPNQMGNGTQHPAAHGEQVGYNQLNALQQAPQTTNQPQGNNPGYGQQFNANQPGMSESQIKGMDVATQYSQPENQKQAHDAARAALAGAQ